MVWFRVGGLVKFVSFSISLVASSAPAFSFWNFSAAAIFLYFLTSVLISDLFVFCGDVVLLPVLRGVAGVAELLVVLQGDGG